MTNETTPVDQLANIGPTIARRLRDVGVRTKGELRIAGPAVVYCRIRADDPGRTLPVCYYLYSLEGALRDVSWESLTPRVKQQLLDEVAARSSAPNSPSRRKRAAAAAPN